MLLRGATTSSSLKFHLEFSSSLDFQRMGLINGSKEAKKISSVNKKKNLCRVQFERSFAALLFSYVKFLKFLLYRFHLVNLTNCLRIFIWSFVIANIFRSIVELVLCKYQLSEYPNIQTFYPNITFTSNSCSFRFKYLHILSLIR